VASKDGVRIRHQPESGFPVAQKPNDLLMQGIRIADLDRGLVPYQSFGERGEIFHVRTKKNGFAGKDGLDRILPAAGGQAFADKHNRGDGIPMLQLAGSIEHDAVGRRSASARLAPQANRQAQSLEPFANFRHTFHMPGRDNQSERREIRPKPLKYFTENFLFARMGASAEENGTVAIDPEVSENFQRQIGIQSHPDGIVFDAADMMNALARHAQPDPPLDVVRLLDANGVETTKSRRDEKKESVKSPFGSFRETSVDEREWNATAARARSKIRPDFCFNENDANRPNGSEGALHDWPEIQRAVEDFHSFIRFGARHLESGRGRRAEHAKKIRIELPKLRR